MKIIQVLPLFFLLLDGCIDPLSLNSFSGKRVLVVDGMITDQPGPYNVKLSWSSPLTGNEDPREVVTGASVWILEDGARSLELSESQPGIYTTESPDVQGETGKTYSLRILTTDGSEYQSTDEVLMPAGEIDTLFAEFEDNSINPTDPSQPQDAITFYLDGKTNAPNASGFARWRSTGIYEIQTFPELRTKMRDEMVVPNPLPCSGYINDNDELVQVDTCSCCNCWVYEYNRRAVVSPNKFADGNEFHGIAVSQVPVDSWRFSHKYYFEVEQLSVSENVYEFWKRISAQQKGTGSLFQPNAVKVVGNIRCTTDPATEVFGVFSASAVVRRSIFIRRGEIPKPIASPDPVTFDCRFVFENSYNVRPPFW